MPATNYARPAQFDRATQHRRVMLAKINIGRQQIGMVEDDYRQVLFEETGKTSLKECSDAQLDAMVGRLKQLGFKPIPKGGGRGAAQHPMARKARALWISLHHLGAVKNPSEEALEAFAKRQIGCEKLVWARQSDAYRLIEALKAMATRHGWRQTDPTNGRKLTPLQLQVHLCEVILAKLRKAGVADPDWTLNQAAFRLCGFDCAEAGPFTIETYAKLAAALGKALRDHAPQEVTS